MNARAKAAGIVAAGAVLVAAGCLGPRPLEAGLPELAMPRPVSARLHRIVVGVAVGGDSAARGVLSAAARSRLEKTGVTVRDLGRAFSFDSSAGSYDAAAGRDGADLVVVLWGEAYQVDRFGQFYSYEARCRGKVLDRVDGGEFGLKQVKARGDRKLTVIEAERSALETAGRELTEHIAGEVVGNIQKNGAAVRILVKGVRSTDEVDRIKAHLLSKPGVVKAKCTSWSKDTRVARMLVRIHPSVKANLAAYLETVHGIAIEVTDVRDRDVSGHRSEEK